MRGRKMWAYRGIWTVSFATRTLVGLEYIYIYIQYTELPFIFILSEDPKLKSISSELKLTSRRHTDHEYESLLFECLFSVLSTYTLYRVDYVMLDGTVYAKQGRTTFSKVG